MEPIRESLNDIAFDLMAIRSTICINYLAYGKSITRVELNVLEKDLKTIEDNIIKLMVSFEK